MEDKAELEVEFAAYKAAAESIKIDLNEKIVALNTENALYKKMMENLQFELKEKAKGSEEEKAAQLESMKVVESNLEEKISDLEQDKMSLKEAKTALEAEHERLTSTNSGLITELNELTGEMKRRGERIDKLETDAATERLRRGKEADQLTALKAELSLASEQLVKVEIQRREMGEQLDAVLAERSAEAEQLTALKAELSSAAEQLVEVEVKRREAAEQVAKLEAQQSVAAEQLAAMKHELAAQVAATEEQQRVVTTQTKELTALDFELASCREKMIAMERSCQTSSELIEELRVKNSGLEADKNSLQKTIVVASIELEKAKEEWAEEEKRMREESREIVHGLAKTLERREERIEALEGQLRTLAETHPHSSDATGIEKDQKADDSLLKGEEEAGNWAEERKVLEEKITLLADELEAKEATLLELTNNLQLTAAELSSVTSDLGSCRQGASLAESQVGELRDELAQAVQDKESCEALLAQSEEALARLRAEFSAAQRLAEQSSVQLTEQEKRLEILADLEAELRYRTEDCSRLETELSLKAERILELELSLTEAQNLNALMSEQERKTGQELTEAKAALEAALLKCEDVERELANCSLGQQLNNSSINQQLHNSSQQLDDSRSEAMSTSTVSRAEELSRMKDIEDSFEDRYAKLKLVAIKLKKKVADQAKLIGELESAGINRAKVNSATTEPEPPNGQWKEKLTALTNNFSRLQVEYDQAVDRVEVLEGQVKALTKDLEASLSESMANKLRAEESGQAATAAKVEAAAALGQLKEKEAEAAALAVTVGQERNERHGLEERLRAAQAVEARLREQAAQGMAVGETATALRLQVGRSLVSFLKFQASYSDCLKVPSHQFRSP